MQEKTEYKLNHEGENLVEGLNMDERRFDEIATEAKVARIRGKDVAEVFEIALNAAQPKDIIEALLLGYTLGRCIEKEKQINPLAQMLQKLDS